MTIFIIVGYLLCHPQLTQQVTYFQYNQILVIVQKERCACSYLLTVFAVKAYNSYLFSKNTL